jgi:hypothetical protein
MGPLRSADGGRLSVAISRSTRLRRRRMTILLQDVHGSWRRLKTGGEEDVLDVSMDDEEDSETARTIPCAHSIVPKWLMGAHENRHF